MMEFGTIENDFYMDFILMSENNKPVLLAIIEVGGYPDFTSVYESFGYEVIKAESVRKAVKLIKKHKPVVMVAEFNFQSDFRDRTSGLETLLSSAQGVADTNMIVFYEKEFSEHYQRFLQNYQVAASLTFPVDESQLHQALADLK